jgi:hypothetical protein
MSTNKQGVEWFFVEKGYVSCLTLTQKGAFLTFELQVGLKVFRSDQKSNNINKVVFITFLIYYRQLTYITHAFHKLNFNRLYL